jgi:hypothetical protein
MKYIIIQFFVIVLLMNYNDAMAQAGIRNDKGITFKLHVEKNGTHITGFSVNGLLRNDEQGKKKLLESFKKLDSFLNLIYTSGDFRDEANVSCKLYSKRAVSVAEVREILLSLNYDFLASSVNITSKKVYPILK